MSLPLELVREIIHLLLFSAPPRSPTPEDPGFSTKPTWGTITALSLTSQSYRTLVLEVWFRTLYIESPGNLIFLRCLVHLLPILRVSSIRLDWLSSSFTFPQADLDTLPFLYLSSMVEHFDLRGRTWPEPRAIQGIANTPGFGRLKTLKMVEGMV